MPATSLGVAVCPGPLAEYCSSTLWCIPHQIVLAVVPTNTYKIPSSVSFAKQCDRPWKKHFELTTSRLSILIHEMKFDASPAYLEGPQHQAFPAKLSVKSAIPASCHRQVMLQAPTEGLEFAKDVVHRFGQKPVHRGTRREI